VAAGDELPDPFAPELVDAASDAFTQALQLAASLSAAVVIAAAVLAWALLRRVGAGPEAEEQRGLEVSPIPDRTPCWQTRARIAEVPDEAGG
jgi:DHA2 family multidrug resistance protein-like MFS transporter